MKNTPKLVCTLQTEIAFFHRWYILHQFRLRFPEVCCVHYNLAVINNQSEFHLPKPTFLISLLSTPDKSPTQPKHPPTTLWEINKQSDLSKDSLCFLPQVMLKTWVETTDKHQSVVLTDAAHTDVSCVCCCEGWLNLNLLQPSLPSSC